MHADHHATPTANNVAPLKNCMINSLPWYLETVNMLLCSSTDTHAGKDLPGSCVKRLPMSAIAKRGCKPVALGKLHEKWLL
eukprot:685217-Amphidinium_carterae.1